ncbi:hypothetical protein L1887_25935 [Cichorium endivia]|nr:hypothetical protein L1887_25935 [Cichorium endivia]
MYSSFQSRNLCNNAEGKEQFGHASPREKIVDGSVSSIDAFNADNSLLALLALGIFSLLIGSDEGFSSCLWDRITFERKLLLVYADFSSFSPESIFEYCGFLDVIVARFFADCSPISKRQIFGVFYHAMRKCPILIRRVVNSPK